MQPDRWKKVCEIYAAVLDQPAANRAAFLGACCGADETLHAEVEALLSMEDKPGILDSLLARIASKGKVTCPSCAAEIAPERFCSHCGANLEPWPTATIPAHHKDVARITSSSVDEGRFPAGTLLGRYRIIGLLGRGGMGEVYRAIDIKLGQPVALKFLPEKMAGDERMLTRFHSEVRLARQISHANVCRVYDIGEFEGVTYLSMEYVDGEDLASLLRRIGRLPPDKAVEIARCLCAGLAAAHDKGVLHRDLKPANIMIDGRGQVRIMDFGLAGIAGQISRIEARNGTPAYMAPEQFEGREVSTRSDIYSLGLVLYEMFAGKRAFESGRNRTARPPSLTSVVSGIDPKVERVIARCLDSDPSNRPASALTVSAALPGGDPLAEALAAGQTPSPAMVAASSDTGAVSVRAALACLASIIAGLVVLLLLSGQTNRLRMTPAPYSAEVLAEKAREMAVQLGYTDPPADRAWGFDYYYAFSRYGAAQEKPADFRTQIAHGQPSPIVFWYRQSPSYLEPSGGDAQVSQIDPPTTEPGMVQFELYPNGELCYLEGVPSAGNRFRASDWNSLFGLAGLDPTRFEPTEPQSVPLVRFDARAAWVGSYGHTPDIPLRVEAASWQGRIVSFRVAGPWTERDRTQAPLILSGSPLTQWSRLAIISFLFLGGIFFAWRNYRSGRSDFTGSRRVVVFALICFSLQWLLAAHHAPTPAEVMRLSWGLSYALFYATLLGVLYLALEPYVRKRWPQSLITWTRLLAGRRQDPLMTGHVLVGIALGAGFGLVHSVRTIILARYLVLPNEVSLSTLLGFGGAASEWLLNLGSDAMFAFASLFLFLLLRSLLRRNWLAATVYVLLGVFLGVMSFPRHPAIGGAFLAVQSGLGLLILIRFGVLPMMLAAFVTDILGVFPLTSDFSAWYAGSSIFAVGSVLILAFWSFRGALAGRQFLNDGFLE